MSPREKAAAAALVVMAALFGAGLFGLFRDRYAKGDIHQPYSSFRSDPLGVRALHDALLEIEGLEVVRNARPLSRLASDRNATILILGISGVVLDLPDRELANAVESLALNGARVVVALVPDERPRSGGNQDPGDDAPAAGPDGPADPAKSDAPGPPAAFPPGAVPPGAVPLPSLAERWGLESLPCSPAEEEGSPARRAIRIGPGPLPEAIEWRGNRCLAYRHADWNTVYELGGRPVLAERRLGRGSMVLALDTYFVSNEGLRAETRPELLSWLLGSATTVVFDEHHLGAEERHGIAWLLRRYRLQGCATVLLVLAGLALWRTGSPLVPPAAAGGELKEGDSGREASAGLEDLLRRGLAPSRVVDACLEEWRRSFARRRPDLDAELSALELDRRDPVAAYRKLQRVVSERGETHER